MSNTNQQPILQCLICHTSVTFSTFIQKFLNIRKTEVADIRDINSKNTAEIHATEDCEGVRITLFLIMP